MSSTMHKKELIVFKGPTSQTGVAFKSEFTSTSFEDNQLDFDAISSVIKRSSVIAVLPIWNSHVGEITISHALSMLFNEEARLYYLWPQRIVFECLSREANGGEKKIISVKVAEQQCSQFINNGGYQFFSKGSSVDAYQIFKDDESFEAVLVAPGTNAANYDLLAEDASNPINFTTFSVLGSYDSDEWTDGNWGDLSSYVSAKNRIFSAIQMPINKTFTESQEELFSSLVDDATSVSDIPKILFVSRYEENKCRLLLEGATTITPEILNDDGADSDIKIIPNVGHAKDAYSSKAQELISSLENFSGIDFIEHLGHGTCFYACPALGIITHGYEKEPTELITRHLIKAHFELLSKLGQSDNASDSEKLYMKYKSLYQQKGKDFIQFKSIGKSWD